jgi:hypothetical protein
VFRRDLSPEAAGEQADRFHALLARMHSGWLTSFTPLTQTNGTSVFKLGTRSGRVLILKHHVERAPFLRELFALTLWQGLPEVPRLLAAPDHAGRTFLLEYVPNRTDLGEPQDLLAAAQCLGRLHAEASLRLAGRGKVAPARPSFAPDHLERTAEIILREDLRSVGPHVAIRDRKQVHFRRRKDTVATIDFEAILLGGMPLTDLVETVRGAIRPDADSHLVDVAAAYCKGWEKPTNVVYPSRRLARWLGEALLQGGSDR